MNETGFASSARSLLRLRLQLLRRRLGGRRASAAVALSALIGVAALLAVGVAELLGRLLPASVATPAQGRIWLELATALLSFLTGLLWVIWPVVAAQIDDAYELGRLRSFPVSSRRLSLLHVAVGMSEPSALLFYGVVAGMVAGLWRMTETAGAGAMVALAVVFVVMNVAAGRCLQNLLLNVMRSRRNAEVMLGAFIVALVATSAVPPVDVSWLSARLAAGFGSDPRDLDFLVGVTRLLGQTPGGLLHRGLWAATEGNWAVVVTSAATMLGIAAVAWWVGLIALRRFYHRGGGRGRPTRKPNCRIRRGGVIGARLRALALPGPVAAVASREIRALWRNKKCRLLLFVPCFLVLLLRLVGAAPLLRYLLGPYWTAWLLTFIGAYVLSILGGQFFANSFGYDGPAVRQYFVGGQPARVWVSGRNLGQALVALIQFSVLCALTLALLPGARAAGMLVPASAFLSSLLGLLGVGNLLSARFPRRFRADLTRRNRPVTAAFVWVLATISLCNGVALLALAPSLRGGLAAAALLALPPVVALVAYLLLLRATPRWLTKHRDRILAIATE